MLFVRFKLIWMASWLLISISIQSIAHTAESGNGTDRGGGDGDVLQFEAAGILAAKELRKIQARNPHDLIEIEADFLEKIISEIEIVSLNCAKVPKKCREHLFLKGKKKHAVNELVRNKQNGRIWLDQNYWNSIQNDLDRIAFAFHEYLRFIVNHRDAKYRFSGEFRALLEETRSREKIQTDFKSYLDAFITAYRAERQVTQEQILSTFRLLIASSEYQACQAGKKPREDFDPAKIEVLIDCLAILPLIEAALPGVKVLSSDKGLISLLDLAISVSKLNEKEATIFRQKLSDKLASLKNRVSEIRKIVQAIPQSHQNLALEKWNQLKQFSNTIPFLDLHENAIAQIEQIDRILIEVGHEAIEITNINGTLKKVCSNKRQYNDFVVCTFQTFSNLVVNDVIPRYVSLIEKSVLALEKVMTMGL